MGFWRTTGTPQSTSRTMNYKAMSSSIYMVTLSLGFTHFFNFKEIISFFLTGKAPWLSREWFIHLHHLVNVHNFSSASWNKATFLAFLSFLQNILIYYHLFKGIINKIKHYVVELILLVLNIVTPTLIRYTVAHPNLVLALITKSFLLKILINLAMFYSSNTFSPLPDFPGWTRSVFLANSTFSVGWQHICILNHKNYFWCIPLVL